MPVADRHTAITKRITATTYAPIAIRIVVMLGGTVILETLTPSPAS